MWSIFRTVLNHINGLGATLALYCLLVPTAWADLNSDRPWSAIFMDLSWRAAGIYLCFLFVYYVFLRDGTKRKTMPDEGAYGGYADMAVDDASSEEGSAEQVPPSAQATAQATPEGTAKEEKTG